MSAATNDLNLSQICGSGSMRITTENDLPLPAAAPTSNDLTGVTVLPTTNGEFLSALFQGLAAPQRPYVLGFGGKPKDRKAWGGEAWRADKSHTDNAALNWWFSLATYAPADDGYHRHEKDCAAVYGVMLDDLDAAAQFLTQIGGGA